MVGSVALPALLAACSSNNNNKNANAGGSSNPVPRTTVNPGAATQIGASGAAPSTPRPGGGSTVGTAVASPGALAEAGAQTITLTATDTNGTNSKYSETNLSAKANQDIALTLQNKGQAVHNWHLLNVTDANGKDIKTDLLDGGKSATIDFTLSKPGTYNFQCDAHPTEMKGTLTIK
jgi:plastocyanin